MPTGQLALRRRTSYVALTFALCLAVVGLFAPRASAADCPSAIEARPVLRRGSIHPCVHVLEDFLRRWYDTASVRRLDVDDRFEADTRSAVRLLQLDFGIPDPAGVVGPATWERMAWMEQVRADGYPFAQRFANLHVYGASNTSPLKIRLARAFASLGVDNVRIDAIIGRATTTGPRNALDSLRRRVAAGDVPDVIVVATGINDLNWVTRAEPRIRNIHDPGVRSLVYRAVLASFVAKFMEYVDTLPTHPPVVWLTVALESPTNDRDDQFNKALFEEQQRRAAAADPDRSALSVLDIAADLVAHPEWFRNDGKHLTAAGHRFRLRCMIAMVDHTATLDVSQALNCPAEGPSLAVADESP